MVLGQKQEVALGEKKDNRDGRHLGGARKGNECHAPAEAKKANSPKAGSSEGCSEPEIALVRKGEQWATGGGRQARAVQGTVTNCLR